MPCALRDVRAIHLEALLDVMHALDEVLDEHSGTPDLDQLGHRASSRRESRRSAEGCLEHRQAERLSERRWVEIAACMCEQMRFLFQSQLAVVLDQGMTEVGLDLLLEVVDALKIDLPGELDRDAETDRELDREMRVLLAIEPAKEAEVVIRFSDNAEGPGVLAVVDDTDVLEVGAGLLLVPGDRDVIELLPLLVVRELIEIDRPVKSREIRHVLEIDQIEAVRVDEIDPGSELPEPFSCDPVDPVAENLVRPKILAIGREGDRTVDDRYHLAVDLRIGRCEQDGLVTGFDQSSDQVVDDTLGPAVPRWGHGEMRPCHDRDSHQSGLR